MVGVFLKITAVDEVDRYRKRMILAVAGEMESLDWTAGQSGFHFKGDVQNYSFPFAPLRKSAVMKQKTTFLGK